MKKERRGCRDEISHNLRRSPVDGTGGAARSSGERIVTTRS